jgi:WW domain-containing protein
MASDSPPRDRSLSASPRSPSTGAQSSPQKPDASSDDATKHTASPSPDEQAPPLPDEEAPPLPDEQPPDDDGWEPVWDATAQSFYFYNRYTKKTQWENPRVPAADVTSGASSLPAAGLGPHDRMGDELPAATGAKATAGGYNPAIHGDYDPNADYAQNGAESDDEQSAAQNATANAAAYAATGTFNRFTGRWQNTALTPENFNDENKSKRQMNAFFDVDAATSTHDGRSLKAERQNKKFSRKEIKAFKEKRREKKEEKRRAWLRD